MSKFSKNFAAMKKTWKTSKQIKEDMFSSVPAGDYIGCLQSLSVGTSKNGNFMLKREHLIEEGELEGEVVYDNMNLSNETSLAFVRRYIEQMGFEAPDDPAELEDLFDEIAKAAPKVKFRVTESGGFTNVSILEVLDDEGGDSSEDEDAPDLDEMDKKELKAYIEEKELDVEVTKRMTEDEIRDAIREAESGDDSSDDDDDDDEDEDEPKYSAEDLSSMKQAELIKVIKELKLDIDPKKYDRKGLRQAILAAMEDTGDDDDDNDAPDLDEMDRAELKAYIAEKELEITITKKMDEDAIREAIREAEDSGEDDGDDAGDEEDDIHTLREFLASHDISPKKGTLDDIEDIEKLKKLALAYEYPEDEMTEDEIELLERLELDECIKKEKKKGKK